MRYRGADADILLGTLDTPLMAPGEGRLLTFDNRLADLSLGWDMSLYNSV